MSTSTGSDRDDFELGGPANTTNGKNVVFI